MDWSPQYDFKLIREARSLGCPFTVVNAAAVGWSSCCHQVSERVRGAGVEELGLS